MPAILPNSSLSWLIVIPFIAQSINSVNQVRVGDGFLSATEELLLAYLVTVELEWVSSFISRLDDSCWKFRLFLNQFLCVKFGNRDHWNMHVRRVRRLVRLDPVFLNPIWWGSSWRCDVIELDISPSGILCLASPWVVWTNLVHSLCTRF